uniref:Uncharacterized protein n=1 Tax=Chaetoceros debilis TaxID=122233 RepID=A0A7S3QC35_9STRA
MYFLSYSNFKKDIPQELIDGDFDLPGNQFVSFTPNSNTLVLTSAKLSPKTSTLTQGLLPRQRISTPLAVASSETAKYFFVKCTINILLWGCDSWALKQSQVVKLSSFHDKSIRQLSPFVNSDSSQE